VKTRQSQIRAMVLWATLLAGGAAAQNERLCADQNGDGMVTPADFTAWISAFNANDPIADVNQDGSVTPADFTAWISAFNQGEDGPICGTFASSGLEVLGQISPVGDVDTYFVAAGAGSDILFTIGETAGSSVSLQVDAYAPNGDLLVSRSVDTGFNIDLYNVGVTGNYRFVVREFGDNGIVSYRITAVVADTVEDADNVHLESGQTAIGTIDLGDIDTFTVDATAGSDLLLTIGETAGSSVSLAVDVYGPNGQFVRRQALDTGFELDLASVPGGRYTYIVRENGSNGSVGYSLTCVVPDATIDQDNVHVSSGQFVIGNIGIGDIDTFTVDATADADLLFSIGETAGSSVSLSVDLYGPAGQFLASQAVDTSFKLDRFNVPAGRYTYVVREFGGNGSVSYSLTPVVADSTIETDNQAITSGQFVVGTVDIGDIDTFTFEGTPGADLHLTIGETGGSSVSLMVEIYNPAGQFVIGDFVDSGFSIELSNMVSGTYTVVVREGFAANAVSYAMTAVVADSVVDTDNVALVNGQNTTGTIDIGDIDTFTIQANAGNDLNFTIQETGGSGFLMRVDLYGPNGQFLATLTQDSSFSINMINLLQSGTYTYVVRDYDGNNAGSYLLAATVLN